MLKKHLERREFHLGALLLIAVALAHCISAGKSPRPVKAVWDLIQLAAMPALAFLFGALSRRFMDTRERVIRCAVGAIELYFLQKVVIYWIQAALAKTPKFYLFSAANAPWFYLVCGEFLLLTLLFERMRWSRRRVLMVSVALGCLSGLVRWIGDDFCLARLLVFLPLFLLGRWTEEERLERVLSLLPVRLAALAGVLAALGVCYWKAKFLLRMEDFFAGNRSYFELPHSLIARLGPLSRLGWYAVVLALALALLALMPGRKLRGLTRMGSVWPMAYLWQRPLTTLVGTALVKPLTERFGGAGMALGLCVALVLTLCTFLPWAVRPVEWLLERAVFWSPSAMPPARTLSGPARWYQRRGGRSALIYTGVFFLLALALTLPFYRSGMSMVWKVDGLRQQYTAMIFLARYLRGTIRTFLATGVLHFSQYTFEAGMGMGVLDILRRDPMLLLCVLAPVKHMEAMYAFLCVARIYLAGLAFIWLCVELDERPGVLEIVLGALSYAFCGFSLFIMIRQPVFQTPGLIYLPLMLAGVERFLHKRRGGLFLVVVALNCINGYYLTYMNTILMAIYLLVRLICLHGKRVGTIAAEIVRLIGYYLWGVALSAIVLLPTIYSYLTCSRTGELGGSSPLFFYDRDYYDLLIHGLVKGCPNLAQDWANLSFTALTLLAIVLLFLRREPRLRPLRVGVLVCTAMICMPAVGRVMNGLGYVTNRWCYGFELVGALVLVYMLPEFLRLSRRDIGVLLLTGGGYLALVLFGKYRGDGAWYAGLLMLALLLAALVVLELYGANVYQRRIVLSLTVILSLVCNLGATFAVEAGNYAKECLEAGTVQETLEHSPVVVAPRLKRDTFYRVEQPARCSNQAMALGYYGTTSYFSVVPSELTEFYKDLALNTMPQSFDMRGFDARASLEALTSVRYYLSTKDRHPYGFEQVDEIDDVRVYENEYVLPLGYTYRSYMTESAYNELNFAEKQQALLQCAVVPDNAVPEQLEEMDPRLSVKEKKKCQVSEMEGVKLDEEKKIIHVGEEGATITFTFKAVPNSETYFYAEGFRFADPKSEESAIVRVEANEDRTQTRLRGQKHKYYVPNQGVSFHLGYAEKGTDTCTILFTEAGDYAYDDFRVYCLPMADYVTDVTRLREEALEQVKERGDRIDGTVTVTADSLLTFSIPCKKGWKLWVDGKRTALTPVNKLFMGAVVGPGTHEITLRYTIPWLPVGAVISALALLAFVVRGALRLRRREPGARERRAERTTD